MDSSPLVSIVMSVYNAEKYLSQAIDSILTQTYKNIEFIIIEDCSTDNSVEIINEFAKIDSRIKVIRKYENKAMSGFIENLNIGISEAKGKYIARMDADDICYQHRLEKQVDFLEKNKDIFIVGSQMDLIDEDNNVIGEMIAECDNQSIYEKMLTRIQLYHPAIMFRNENVFYREKIWYCEDYDLYLRMMCEGKKMANINQKLLKYRLLNSSISRKNTKVVKYMFLSKIFEMYNERKKSDSPNDSYDEIEVENYLNILNLSYRNSLADLKRAVRICKKNGYKENLSFLVKKINKYYPNYNTLFLKSLDLLPNFLFSVYSKIYRKVI